MPTQIAKSIKQDGTGDYTTIAGFAAAITANLVTADEYWTGTINDSNTCTENVSFTGVTADATRSVTLQAGSGQTPTVAGSSIAVWCNIQYMKVLGVTMKGTANLSQACRLNQPGVVIQDCVLTGSSTNITGIQIRSASVTVRRCVFHTTAFGVGWNTGGDDCIVENCLIRNITSHGIDLALSTMNGTLLYHNTIVVTGTSNGIIVRNISTPVNIIKNNIIQCANGHCISLGPVSSAAGITSDNNRFYVTGTGHIASISTTNYTTLADWQGATVHDDNSASGAPQWTNPAGGDYTLTGVDPGETGLGVTDDITGATRDATPDRGCYERFELTDSFTMSGGATLGGGATVTMALTMAMAGGIILGGAAEFSHIIGGGSTWKRTGIRDAMRSGIASGVG